MRRSASFCTILATLVLLLVSNGAQAQASRTWVSGVGDDANPCSRTAPCKTFAGTISKTAVNGEINCLDPAGFGAVTITKSITIDCHEIFASILVAGTNAINIAFDNFAGSDFFKTVRLRNINFNGLSNSPIGISITGANASSSLVYVEDCLIDGFLSGTQAGISDSRSGGGTLLVSNTTIRNVGTGILLQPSSGQVKTDAVITNVRIANATDGVSANGQAHVMIKDARISLATHGVLATTSSDVSINSSVITNNNTGIEATGSAAVRFSDTDLANNFGSALFGPTKSFGNNRISGPNLGTPPTAVGLQ